MKTKTLIPLALLAALLAGCQERASEPQAENGQAKPATTAAATPGETPIDSDAAAFVDGRAISKSRLQAAVMENQRPGVDPAQLQKSVLDSLINIEVLVHEAEKLSIDKRSDVVAKLEDQRRNALSTALIQEQLATFSITDDQLKAEYDKEFAKAEKEYKARHILVETEDAAKAIISELDGGADFAELAKAKSTGPSGSSGGDLGWFTAERMVKPFSDTVATLEKGSYTKTPVKTQFGWHVIKLEDTRDVQPPEFKDVSAQLKTLLQRRHIQTYLATLRDKADIKIP